MLVAVTTASLLAIFLAIAQERAAPPRTPTPPAATAPAPVRLGAEWAGLVGEWKGTGSGSPGKGGGTVSFQPDLDGHILIRRSTSDYPAGGGRPATHHEDLLVIHPGASPAEARAVYFDNEGHVIEYAAAWSADRKTLTFLSSAQARGPRFRLVYEFLSPDRLSAVFAVAPHGTLEFKTYVSGIIERVRR
jgi:hypothetical protein